MPKIKFIKVCKLEEYQHYHDRHMPWFKWYSDCLQSHSFMTLTEVQRWVFIGFICLATKSNNQVKYDLPWLEKVLNTSNLKENIDVLVSRQMLEFVYTNAIPIREDKIREDKIRKGKFPSYEETQKAWNEAKKKVNETKGDK